MKNRKQKGKILRRCILLACLLLPGLTPLWADNPIVTHIYTADPAPIVYNDRFYIFCGHDEGGTSGGWIMREWRVLSSSDMVNWTDHGPVLRVSNVSWLNTDQAWASQCVEKNGRFYYYICDSGEIGVAVSDNILGPYSDALGRPLITNQTPGACPGDDNIDPHCFIDDDGQAYLYWGTDRVARQARLNSDMISIQGNIEVPQGLNRFFEASWVHKRNGIYYYSYAAYNSSGNNWPSNIDYATASNPMGPWTYRGTLNGAAGVGTNHPGIAEYMGQWYFVYHTDYLSGGVAWQRSVSVDYLYYNSDGTMRQIVQTTGGVDPVNTPVPTPDPTPTPTPDIDGNIIIRARGTLGGEILELHIDDNVVSTWTMSTGYLDYYANGSGTIEVHFINDDAVQNGMDIQVDYIIYDDTTYQAEDQEINTALYIDGACGGSYSEMLECNGYIRFDTGSVIPDNLGDVNSDDVIDIVDALLVAQFYVGLIPSNFDQDKADTNCDGNIDIVDALLIAQRYVGLINGFC